MLDGPSSQLSNLFPLYALYSGTKAPGEDPVEVNSNSCAYEVDVVPRCRFLQECVNQLFDDMFSETDLTLAKSHGRE